MSKFGVICYFKPPTMEKSKWISMFEGMDIYKPAPLNFKVYAGQPDPDFVRESCNGCIQSMYELKKKIGHLSERSQLNHLKNNPVPIPVRPNFDPNNPDHDMMAQAFYQDFLYYYEFVADYTTYLENLVNKKSNNSIEMNGSATTFYKDIAHQLSVDNI